jgi:hypothetical protein
MTGDWQAGIDGLRCPCSAVAVKLVDARSSSHAVGRMGRHAAGLGITCCAPLPPGSCVRVGRKNGASDTQSWNLVERCLHTRRHAPGSSPMFDQFSGSFIPSSKLAAMAARSAGSVVPYRRAQGRQRALAEITRKTVATDTLRWGFSNARSPAVYCVTAPPWRAGGGRLTIWPDDGWLRASAPATLMRLCWPVSIRSPSIANNMHDWTAGLERGQKHVLCENRLAGPPQSTH